MAEINDVILTLCCCAAVMCMALLLSLVDVSQSKAEFAVKRQ
jgi:hypothetical protein